MLKKFLVLSVAATLMASSLTACNPDGTVSATQLGSIAGAVGTGYLAQKHIGGGKGKVLAGIAGSILGSYLGSNVAGMLTEGDAQASQLAATRAFTGGTPTTWSNPATGVTGVVTPVRTVQTTSGSVCKEFRQTIQVDGRSQDATGVACKQSDGTWKIVQQ